MQVTIGPKENLKTVKWPRTVTVEGKGCLTIGPAEHGHVSISTPKWVSIEELRAFVPIIVRYLESMP